MIFEVAKQNLLKYLNVHPSITSVAQPKNAKAITEEGTEADVEYHLDVQFKVKEEVHEVKLILYTTNCRIRVQHAGKKQCKPYEYLKNCCPPKYLAESVIMPFCKRAYDEFKDREVAFISHLKEEINRLVAEGGKAKMNKPKAAPKNNIRAKCAAPKCKHKNLVDTKKDGRFGKCSQCD